MNGNGQQAAGRSLRVIAARINGKEEIMLKSNTVREIGYRILKFLVGLGAVWLKKIEDARGQGQ